MNREDTTIYEAQLNRCGERTCGAAALSMVYRSYEIDCDQMSIWENLKKYSGNESKARTFHLARNALEHGLSAVVVRLRHPEMFLLSDLSAVRLVAVHRVRPESGLGHFSLFVGADAASGTVLLHDPQFGPNRELSIAELCRLWMPNGADCEITRNIAILVAEKQNGPTNCPKCSRTFYREPLRFFETTVFEAMFCPWCDAKIGKTEPEATEPEA